MPPFVKNLPLIIIALALLVLALYYPTQVKLENSGAASANLLIDDQSLAVETGPSQTVIPLNGGDAMRNECFDLVRAVAGNSIERADLLQQCRMAVATEEMSELAKWQFIAGTLGVLLLVSTFVLTIRATNAAMNSAKATKRSADAMINSEKAFLVISDAYLRHAGMRSLGPNNSQYVALGFLYNVKNVGRTHSFNVRCDLRIITHESQNVDIGTND